MAEHKVKVHIRGLPYFPRGKAAEYRAGSVQILDADEAYELDQAGIATIVEDPCNEAPVDPYASAPAEAGPVPVPNAPVPPQDETPPQDPPKDEEPSDSGDESGEGGESGESGEGSEEESGGSEDSDSGEGDKVEE